MNCIEARRRVLVQPRGCEGDVKSHLRACPGCSAFAERTADLEQRIRNAIAIPVSPPLAAHVAELALLCVRRSRRRLIALAAASAVAFGAGLTATLAHDDPEALAGIDFVVDEEANAILSAGPADPAALRRAVDALGIRLPKQLGGFRYIGTCPFMGTIAHHIVVATSYGKVTVLLMPDREVDRRKSAHARGLRAVVRPVRHGCFAIIGKSVRSVARVVEMILAG